MVTATLALLLLWLAFFLGVVVWAYAPRRRRAFDRHALIPLNDD